MAVAAVQLDGLGRGRSFFYDDWSFVMDRRGPLVDTLLQPHNGHLSLLPAGVFRLMFEVIGLEHYRPYRWLAIATHLLVVVLVAVLVRRVSGWWFAFPVAAATALLGSGWQNTLWPFQIGFMGSIAAGLGAHVVLANRRRDPFAALLVGASLACASLGLPIAVGVAARLACRRADWARWWVVVAPSVLWGIWYLGYGEAQGSSDNIPILGSYVASSAAAAVAGLGDLTLDWGRLLAGIGLGAWLVTIASRRAVPARAVGWAATVGAFWVLTGYSRAQFGEPAASRYVYFGGIFILLLAAEYAPARPPRAVAAGAWLALGLGIWGNQAILEGGASGLRHVSEVVAAELYALELAQDDVAADYRPDPVLAPPLVADKYFAAVAEFGSPAADAGTVGRSSNEARQQADRVLLELYRPSLTPLDRPLPPRCDDVVTGDDLRVSAGGLVLVPTPGDVLEIGLRRFGDGPSTAPTLLGGGELQLPDDGSERPWRARVITGAGQICSGA